VQTEILVDERHHRIAMVVRNDRKWTQGIGLKSIDGALACFAVQSLIGDFGEPLPGLAVHIMQVGELSEWPEVFARIPNGTLDLSFFPTGRYVTGFRIETLFASECEESREKTDETSIVFGDSGRQIVVGDLAGNAAHRRERMHMTPDEGFETLAVSELQIQHAAVRFDQGEGIELALVALIIESAEVPPIYFEALTWRRLHPQKGAGGLHLWTNRVDVRAQDTVAAAIAQRAQTLLDHRGRGGGIFFQPLRDGGFESIELAIALPLSRRLRWRIEILLDCPPAHAQVALDLADRPPLGPVEAMQVIDLIGGEHAEFCYPAEAGWAPGRCCLQDSDCGGLRGGSASRIQTCAGTELLFARPSRPEPRSQISAAERFRSKAELLLARSPRRRLRSRTRCRWRLRSTDSGCFPRYRCQ
jgi:hypothetical protein